MSRLAVLALLCYNSTVTVQVFAKLNLTLNVEKKRGEFHPIDSVATSVDIYDTVSVAERSDKEVFVSGVDQVETEQNSAYRAAKAFQRAFATHGVEISIEKGIPFGAGMGGSSADASAVIYCMCKLFNVDIHSVAVHNLCVSLGSDVNFMLFGGLGRLQGKGDDVTFFNLKQPLYFVLTTFDVSMNSGAIYSAFDKICKYSVNNISQQPAKNSNQSKQLFEDSTNTKLLTLLEQGANKQALPLFSNDLGQAAHATSNYAESYLDFCKEHSLRCNMTGSGSAYYVACVSLDEAEQVCKLLNANGFTTTICQSVPSGIVEI